MAVSFLEETRRDIEKSAPAGTDVPPRIRSVHERPGHATPEYRTLAVPVPAGEEAASPEVLSGVIAAYGAQKKPHCLLLTLQAEMAGANGTAYPVLIAEAHDWLGTRLFWMQPFRMEGGRVRWEEPLEGGWRDPAGAEMILDAAFAGRAAHAAREPSSRRRSARAPTAGAQPPAG